MRPLRQPGRSGRFAILILVLASSLAALSAYAEDNDTWALLKKPGHVILLRHSNAPNGVTEVDGIDLKNCAVQRNLDDEGRAQARRIGDAFRKHGLTRARLVSSQYCRALETAKLTGLGPVRELPALNLVTLLDLSGLKETADKTTRFIKSIPATQLTILVSHVGNILAISSANLSSGEMAVVHIDASGTIVVDGRLKIP